MIGLPTVPVTTAGAAVQVPISFHGLPPLNATPAESLNFGAVALGAIVSRNRAGGVLPDPCRKMVGFAWAAAWPGDTAMPTTAIAPSTATRAALIE